LSWLLVVNQYKIQNLSLYVSIMNYSSMFPCGIGTKKHTKNTSIFVVMLLVSVFFLTWCSLHINTPTDEEEVVLEETLETEKSLLEEYEDNDQEDKTIEVTRTTNQVKFMLANEPEEFDFTDISQYFVPITVTLAQPISTTEEKIHWALTKLFELDGFFYGTQQYHNYISYSDLSVANVVYLGWRYHIYLEGRLSGAGSMADPFVLGQVTETIKMYTQHFIVFLNNSEQQRRCSMDHSGLCQ